MIKINLARHLQVPVESRNEGTVKYWVVSGFLLLAMVVGSGWWTYTLQQQIDDLTHDKEARTQAVSLLQKRQLEVEHYGKDKLLLMASVDQLKAQEKEKVWPVVLMNALSRSVEGLDVWLERVQLESKVVELQGQSFSQEDISKVIEVLEQEEIIKSLSVVEILDPVIDQSATFPFLIRFVYGHHVTT